MYTWMPIILQGLLTALAIYVLGRKALLRVYSVWLETKEILDQRRKDNAKPMTKNTKKVTNVDDTVSK